MALVSWVRLVPLPQAPSLDTLSSVAMDANSFVELKANPSIPAFRPGDTVRVYAKVIEGDRQRIQAFEGVVLRVRRGGVNSNFTVRRISHGIGVERVFPYFSPLIDKVEVIRVGRVRRAKLYYLRDRVGKAARIKPGSRARFEELTAGRPAAIHEEEQEEAIEQAEEEIVETEAMAEDEEEAVEEAEAAEAAEAVAEPETVAPEAEAAVEEAAVEEPEAEVAEAPEVPAETKPAAEGVGAEEQK